MRIRPPPWERPTTRVEAQKLNRFHLLANIESLKFLAGHEVCAIGILRRWQIFRLFTSHSVSHSSEVSVVFRARCDIRLTGASVFSSRLVRISVSSAVQMIRWRQAESRSDFSGCRTLPTKSAERKVSGGEKYFLNPSLGQINSDQKWADRRGLFAARKSIQAAILCD